MSNNANRYKPKATTNTPRRPRRSPAEVGRALARTGSLKGLPYGPGEAQEAALKAFRQVSKEAA
jgi:hypothetical protein